MSRRELAILGCGKMGEAILSGLQATENGPDLSLRATARRPEVVRRLADKYGVPVGSNNVEAAESADIVVLATKPQVAGYVLGQERMRQALADKPLISICAGLTIQQIETWVPEAVVLRAMPNTPALIREGMTVLSPGHRATEEHVAVAKEIFEAVGRCRVLEEKHMDAVTGLSGSGPAFACVILESLADGGVMMGLPRDVAIELAAQTFQGAARLVLETGLHPAALKDQVTTPAGCTIAGLLTMEDGRIRSILARSIQEATLVAGGLGKQE